MDTYTGTLDALVDVYSDGHDSGVDEIVDDNKVQYSKIIPDDIQEKLITFNSASTGICFAIGDIANTIYSATKEEGGITQKLVDQAVGYFCGKSGRTVRYYREISQFFPHEMRDTYDMLSFQHFAIAKKFPNWEKVLEYAADGPRSVDKTIAHFHGVMSDGSSSEYTDLVEAKDAPNSEERDDSIDDVRGSMSYVISLLKKIARFVNDSRIESVIETIEQIRDDAL